jgi:hypothetical protein
MAAAASIMIILRSATRAQMLTMGLLGLLLGAGSLAYTFFRVAEPEAHDLWIHLRDLNRLSRFSDAFLEHVFAIIVAINVIAAIVPVIMLLVCSTLAPCAGTKR